MSAAVQEYYFSHYEAQNKENNVPYLSDNTRKRTSINKKYKVTIKQIVRNSLQLDTESSESDRTSVQELSNPLLLRTLNAGNVRKVEHVNKEIPDRTDKALHYETNAFGQRRRIPALRRNATRETILPEITRRSLRTLTQKVEEPAEVDDEPEIPAAHESHAFRVTRNDSQSLMGRSVGRGEVVITPRKKMPNTMKVYANDIIETLKEKDAELRPSHFLKNHSIAAGLRAKMIDWMIEVMCSYKCSDQSFFLAVNIMDAYFKKTEGLQNSTELHLVGVTSMLMASKFEEIYSMRISVVQDKIAHKKFTIDEIVNKEGEILKALGYNLVSATTHEFIKNVLFQLKLDKIMTAELYEYLQRVCLYFSKANMYDYELLSQYNSCELAACTLYVSFKVIAQLDNTFPVSSMVDKVCDILGVDDDVLYLCATKILALAKNFEMNYPNLKNLRRFHSISVPGKSSGVDEASIMGSSSTPTNKRASPQC